MRKARRNEEKKWNGMPLEQLEYDLVKVNRQLEKQKKAVDIRNKSISAAFFVLVGLALLLLVLFFISGDSISIDWKRILGNLQNLYLGNLTMVMEHLKINVLSLKETAVITISSFLLPNFLYLGVGIKKILDRIGINGNDGQSIKQLWKNIAFNIIIVWDGIQQGISTVKQNFLSIFGDVLNMMVEIKEKLQAIRK